MESKAKQRGGGWEGREVTGNKLRGATWNESDKNQPNECLRTEKRRTRTVALAMRIEASGATNCTSGSFLIIALTLLTGSLVKRSMLVGCLLAFWLSLVGWIQDLEVCARQCSLSFLGDTENKRSGRNTHTPFISFPLPSNEQKQKQNQKQKTNNLTPSKHKQLHVRVLVADCC